MSRQPKTVNTQPIFHILIVTIITLFCFSSAWAAEPFTINPVDKPADVKLLPPTAWPPPEGDRGSMLLKLAYLRGLLDALQYVELSPDSPYQVLRALQGKDLSQVAAEVDRYYLTTPQGRNLPPAAVVMRVLPGLADKEKKAPKP